MYSTLTVRCRRVGSKAWTLVGLVTLPLAPLALGQVAFVSSVNNSLERVVAGDQTESLRIGHYINEVPATLVTGPDSHAMLFFVGGLGGVGAEFKGAIVVLMDQNTRLEILEGRGRMLPFDFIVQQGQIKVHFDAREHREHVRVGTPLATMEVTGSILWAQHDPAQGRSMLASEDSNAMVNAPRIGGERSLLSGQKLIATADALGEPEMLTDADRALWQLPNLPLISAMAQRSTVREDRTARVYAALEVVEEGAVAQLIEEARLEEVNVPEQVAILQTQADNSLLLAATRVTGPQNFGAAATQIGAFGVGGGAGITASRSAKLPPPVRGGGGG